MRRNRKKRTQVKKKMNGSRFTLLRGTHRKNTNKKSDTFSEMKHKTLYFAPKYIFLSNYFCWISNYTPIGPVLNLRTGTSCSWWNLPVLQNFCVSQFFAFTQYFLLYSMSILENLKKKKWILEIYWNDWSDD